MTEMSTGTMRLTMIVSILRQVPQDRLVRRQYHLRIVPSSVNPIVRLSHMLYLFRTLNHLVSQSKRPTRSMHYRVHLLRLRSCSLLPVVSGLDNELEASSNAGQEDDASQVGCKRTEEKAISLIVIVPLSTSLESDTYQLVHL